MAYLVIEQETLDLDLYLNDPKKRIHIASGGGRIPNRIAEFDSVIEEFKETVEEMSEVEEIEVNPNLIELLNLNENSLQTYLESFLDKARKGFYSYDKTKLENKQDYTFHLVAKPKDDQTFQASNNDNLPKIDKVLPTDFKPFILKEYTDE